MSFRESFARPQQSQSVDNDPFTSQLQQLRLAYANKQNFTDLHYRADRFDHDVDIVKIYHFWLQAGAAVRFLRIVDIPGTLSGKLLRLEAKLPSLTGHTEIEGNIIRSITNPPDLPPEELEDDSDDLTDQVESLPLFDTSANPSLYFTKQPRYKSEIPNLLACQGGCPATTPSPYVVELLGKTEDGRLVFPKLLNRSKAAIAIQQWLETYKKWIHQLVSGVQYLHSKSIVHRDLRVDNLLWKLDKSERVEVTETLDPDELPKTLVICDLESKWGQRQAPEIIHNGKTVDAGWTKYSDIWDVGNCIKCIIYGNAPINDVVVWDIPSPFAEMVKACQRPIPSERATPAELLNMLGPIS